MMNLVHGKKQPSIRKTDTSRSLTCEVPGFVGGEVPGFVGGEVPGFHSSHAFTGDTLYS